MATQAEMLSANLSHQLERLEAMRRSAARLMARARLGRDFFARGQPEVTHADTTAHYGPTIMELLEAYARVCRPHLPPSEYY